jgi:hypothetical protein
MAISAEGTRADSPDVERALYNGKICCVSICQKEWLLAKPLAELRLRDVSCAQPSWCERVSASFSVSPVQFLRPGARAQYAGR